MARKEKIADPRTQNDRVGLMVTRGQVMTEEGHGALQARMFFDNSRNIIAFGSSQRSREPGNPLTADQKRRALYALWGDAFKMIFLQDIGATDRNSDWADYVLDRIRTNQLPDPTDLYAGSVHDARWYEGMFAPLTGEPSYKRGGFDVWENRETGKRVHILNRHTNRLAVSASAVRDLIERRDPSWRDFVPARLWEFYEWEYPPELRVAVEWPFGVDALPGADEYPLGTKLLARGRPEVLVLRDDGRWRPRTPAEIANAKSLGD